MRVLASAALVAWVVLGPASAGFAATGTGTLSIDPADADLIRVECFDDGSGMPASLVAQIRDEVPVESPFVSVQIVKGSAATNATDAIDGDGLMSPAVFVDGGAGDYDVFIDKSGAGEETYQLQVQCMTGAGGTGAATGTFVAAWTSPVPLMDGFARALMVGLFAGVVVWRSLVARARRGKGWA